MNDELLDRILPFHLVLDGGGVIRRTGSGFDRLVPGATGQPLAQVSTAVGGTVDTSMSPRPSWSGASAQLSFDEHDVVLRGDFHGMGDGFWLFAAVLDPSLADRLPEFGLSPADFPSADLTMDFSMLKWTRDSQVRETRYALHELRAAVDRGTQLRHRADIDLLTGIPNRARFLETLDDALATARRDGTRVAVLMIDIDRFKSINDLYGHAAGDRALIAVARHLAWVVGDLGTVGRIGGDEFAIVVNDASGDIARLKLLVDHLCTDVLAIAGQPVDIGERSTPISVSIGVAFDTEGKEAGALLRHADVAMYAARRGGDTSPVGVFDPEAQHELALRRSLADELAGALERDEIDLLFQPIVDLQTRRVVKYEVLSRWHHTQHGNVPPALFFEIAEQCQLIQRLDRHVITKALRTAQNELAMRGEGPHLSVNLSALSLTDDLPIFLKDALDALSFPANRLCVEVTETSSITDLGRTGRVLRELDALGIVVALDDFGTGFSSLTYLHQLPIGALKIDRSFVADMLESRKALELVRSILQVADSLGLPVVAEGIETVEQCVMLRNLGCPQGQGYYFAHPAPAEVAGETLGRTLPFSSSEVDPTRRTPPIDLGTLTA